MVEEQGRKAGLMQLLRAQATRLLGQCEALTGGDLLTKEQKEMMPIADTLVDLQKYQSAEDLSQEEFTAAHKQLQEIGPAIKAIVETMDVEQKKKYDKKAEKKVVAHTLKHREKLQKQFNEVASQMPEQHKLRLNEAMKRMPLSRQEQFIAELVAQHQRRQGLTEAQKQAEDREMMETSVAFQQILSTLDPMQKQILQSNLANMLPSGQVAFMKKVVDGEVADLIPPSTEDVKDWKAFYLSYFNSEMSVKKGRVMPLELCVKNPRPDEVMEAFRALKIRAIFESGKQRPNDNVHVGRFRFQLFDVNGNLVNDQYRSKRQVMRLVGKHLVESPIRTDPVTCAEKAKEGVFDMEAEMAQIEQAMQQVHGPTIGQAQQQAQAQVKADKKKNKKRR